MGKKEKIIWLKRKDLIKKILGTGVTALSYPQKKLIIAQKGKATATDIEHERGHISLRHGDELPRSPQAHVRAELRANYYAYKKIGRPKHILLQLRALYNDLHFREYRVRPTSRILKMIRAELLALPHPPAGWLQDYKELVREAQRR
jgi:hypothetical protein